MPARLKAIAVIFKSDYGSFAAFTRNMYTARQFKPGFGIKNVFQIFKRVGNGIAYKISAVGKVHYTRIRYVFRKNNPYKMFFDS